MNILVCIAFLFFALTSCKLRNTTEGKLANKDQVNTFKTTKFFLKKGDILDFQVSQITRKSVPKAAIRELNSRMNEFQSAWDKAAKFGMLEVSTKLAQRDFGRREYTIWASLAPLTPMGRPLIVNMAPYLKNGGHNNKPSSSLAFVSMAHHEVLHFLVENIEGPVLFEVSPLAKKYKNEKVNVLAHIHLMALQKSTYLKMGLLGKKLLAETVVLYEKIIKGDYERAWEIVKLEGHQKFLDELAAANSR